MTGHHLLQEYRRTLLSFSEIPNLPRENLIILIQKGMIRELLENPTQESITILEDVCAFAPLPTIQEDAFEALIELCQDNHPEAILSLYSLAVEREHPPAIAYLKNHPHTSPNPCLQAAFSFLCVAEDDYAQFDQNLALLADYFFHHAQPSTRLKIIQSAASPARQRIARLLDVLMFDEPEKPTRLLTLYPQCSQLEKRIILQRLSSLVEKKNTQAEEIVCRLAILFDDPDASEICKQRNLSPSAPADKALYYFLSSNWDEYETFDFTHQWLAEAYSTASPSLRQKILLQARSSGHIEWLSNISSNRPAIGVWDLSPMDWEKLAHGILSSSSDLHWLRLINHAPLFWTAYLLNFLAKNSFVFDNEPELLPISQLAADCISHPLPFIPKSVLHSPAGSSMYMAVSPFGMEIGLGGLDSSIQILNLNSLEWQKPILNPAAPTRLIAYDPSASYLVCAGGDHRLRIFRRQDYALLKTIEGHKNQIKAIVFQSDGRVFYSAGFDGTIQSWHFPSGLAARSPLQLGNEIFSLIISPDNQLLFIASADQTCPIIPVQQNQAIHSIAEIDDIPLALSLNKRQKFVVSVRNNTIRQFSLSTFRPVTPSRSTHSLIHNLVYHPTLPLLIGMGVDGKTHIWHEADLSLLLTIEQHNQPSIGLGVTPDGNTLISASSDGKIVIGDLQPFLLFFQPIQSDLHQWIEKLALWSTNQLQPSNHRAWFEFAKQILQWRGRFDIQIEDVEAIQIGEYDILF